MKRLLCLVILLASCSEPQIGRDFNRDAEQGGYRVRTIKYTGYDSLNVGEHVDFCLLIGM
jgi:hypothetical protein